MRLQLMIFLILLVTPALSDTQQKELAGYEARVDVIAENYEAGAFLIYDCVEKHWTCVLESYHTECNKKRELDIAQKKEDLRCAGLGPFPTKKSCFQQQLFMVSQNHSQRFCIGPQMKQKEIEF